MKLIQQNNFYLVNFNLLEYCSEVDRDFIALLITPVEVAGRTLYKFHRFFTVEIVLSILSAGHKDVAQFLVENTALYSILFDQKIDKPIHLDKAKKIFKVDLMAHQNNFVLHYGEYKSNLNLKGYYLAFDVGTGKTLAAMYTALAYGSRFVVVCPKTLILNWLDEIEKLTVIPREQVCAFPLEMPHKDTIAIITNFDNVRKINITWNPVTERTFLIVDEAQVVRYADTITIQNMYKFCVMHSINDILLLSGTPVKGRYAELSGAFLLLDPLFDMDAYPYFIKAYNSPKAIKAIDLIKHRLSLSMLRVTRHEVQAHLALPPKHEITVETHVDNVSIYLVDTIVNEAREHTKECLQQQQTSLDKTKQELIQLLDNLYNNDLISPETKQNIKTIRDSVHDNTIRPSKAILVMRKQIQEELTQKGLTKEAKQFNKLLTTIMMVELKCFASKLMQNYKQTLIRLVTELYDKNIKLIRDLVSEGERIIIFTNYRFTLEAIMKVLQKHGLNNVVYITGEKSLKQRKQAIDQFKNQPETILIATYASLSFGYTLTEGRIVIYADLPFRDVDLHQAIARVYRKSQTRETYVYYLKIATTELTIQQKQEMLVTLFKERVRKLFDEPVTRQFDLKKLESRVIA